MGTITARKRKDGSTGYTAQIRIMRDGNKALTESQTFDRKQAASAWLKKRETELATPEGLAKATGPNPTLCEVIAKYLEEIAVINPVGRTKGHTLRAIGRSSLGAMKALDIRSNHIVEYAQGRVANDGVQWSTASNEVMSMSAVFSVAQAAWGYNLDYDEVRKAKAVMRKLGMWARPKERMRRPTMQELDALFLHLEDRARRREWAVPLMKIVAFAMFSARRQEEVLKLLWADVDEKERTVVVRDMKNPTMKWGNHVTCKLPDEAWAILQSMPRMDERIFPYGLTGVSASFTRACRWVGITDLHFHDLRHEGVSRLFEMGWDIPRVAAVSGHRNWNMLRRYTHLQADGDRYENWPWLAKAVAQKAELCTVKRRESYTGFAREEVRDSGIRRVKSAATDAG
ncbi:tyrosine-type recombinase/integrase [Agrobacterium tumefaciens]|uniref:tyrosine-type recombinase/integrase n=1 Tax=Agrobacterium tumefaciens TaxID=358 RepID=UPI0015738305|nr:site-specific integrase [Agrobacterium tumefaciens]